MENKETKFTEETIATRKLSFRSRFIKNPIDERINKQQMLKVALDKKESKEILSLLNKTYHNSKPKRSDNNRDDNEINFKKV